MTLAQLQKSIRTSSPGVRWLYAGARRGLALVRDRARYAAVRQASRSAHAIRREDGFLVLRPGAIPGTDAVVEEARAALAAFDREQPPAGKNRKRFLVNVLHDAGLTLPSPFVRLALDEDVLAAVGRYLGIAPVITRIAVFHSDVVDAAPTSSQLYHCDGDEVSQVKVFVYCSDVEPRSGPLTIVGAGDTADVLRRTKYTFDMRLTDADVLGQQDRSREHPILGPSGTTVLVDTSRCLHFGSRVEPDAPPRLVTMIQYSTPYAFKLPARYQDGAPFRRLLDASLSPLQRFALGE